MRLHDTLDKIDKQSCGSAQLSQRIVNDRIDARCRRKALERRAQALVPDSGIDPDDTGEFVIEAAG